MANTAIETQSKIQILIVLIIISTDSRLLVIPPIIHIQITTILVTKPRKKHALTLVLTKKPIRIRTKEEILQSFVIVVILEDMSVVSVEPILTSYLKDKSVHINHKLHMIIINTIRESIA